jgi:hypothetical protein
MKDPAKLAMKEGLIRVRQTRGSELDIDIMTEPTSVQVSSLAKLVKQQEGDVTVIYSLGSPDKPIYGEARNIGELMRAVREQWPKKPEVQPINPREAADLGVSAKRVPEVLRRKMEAGSATQAAAKREPAKPSLVEKVGEGGKLKAKGGKLLTEQRFIELMEAHDRIKSSDARLKDFTDPMKVRRAVNDQASSIETVLRDAEREVGAAGRASLAKEVREVREVLGRARDSAKVPGEAESAVVDVDTGLSLLHGLVLRMGGRHELIRTAGHAYPDWRATLKKPSAKPSLVEKIGKGRKR